MKIVANIVLVETSLQWIVWGNENPLVRVTILILVETSLQYYKGAFKLSNQEPQSLF